MDQTRKHTTRSSEAGALAEYPVLGKDAAPSLALPWVVRLRYGMVSGGAIALFAAAWVFRSDLRLLWSALPLFLVLTSNIWLQSQDGMPVHAAQHILGVIFVLDTLCLTAVLGLTGGPMNPFSLLYLVQITLSIVVLSKAWTWVLGALSAACFGTLFFFNVPFIEFHIPGNAQGFSSHIIGMWIAFVIAAALISFFTGRVSDELRFREREVLLLQERVARQERLASLVTLAAGAAHELCTPLSTIAVVARDLEHFASTLTDGGDLRDDAKLIRSEVARCQLILQRMSADGAEPMGEPPREIQLRQLVEQSLQAVPEGRRPDVLIEIPEDEAELFLPVNATVQSLVALIGNALDSGTRGASVTVRAQRKNDAVAFSVVDHGHGMTDDVLRRIAMPFFTTKDPGRGMGLGTFLVRTFAERLGGGLTYQSIPGKGTTATLILPTHLSGQENINRA
ncbi:MAG TPA: ATP-binding protein [Acidobacteriaceae bacterium]|nr:ATP-binding protein [Acidobacteriaceae bacterium]